MIDQIVKDNTVDLIKKVCYINEVDSAQFVEMYTCTSNELNYDGEENQLGSFTYTLVLTLEALAIGKEIYPALATSDISKQFREFVETVVMMNMDQGYTVRKIAGIMFEGNKEMLDFFDSEIARRNKEQK